MLAISMKQKVDRQLKKAGYKKSTISKGRITPNQESGYTFDKIWDDYYLFYTGGNLSQRGMSNEEKDNKTIEIFNYLKTTELVDYIEMTTLRDRKAVILLHDK